MVPVGLVQVFDHHHLVARPWWLPELEVHDLAFFRQLDFFDLVERLHTALHLRGLGGVRGKPVDEPLLLGQHRLLPGIRGLTIGLTNRLLAFVVFVVAGVDGDLAVVDFGNPGDDAVHELAVVGGHEQGGRQALEETLEPDDRFDVEVVGRFVHQQDVWPAEQDPGHGDPHLPSTRQVADVTIDSAVVKSEAV